MSLVDEFVALNADQRAAVRTFAIHCETINARDEHISRPQDAAGLYKITERIHRLASGVLHALGDAGDKGRWAMELVFDARAIPVEKLKSWIEGQRTDG